MATLSDQQGSKIVKMLLLGDSSAGKTGALATLAIAGYRLFIADFDNGLDILLDKKVLPEEFRKNVFVKNFYDKNTLLGGAIRPEATGFTNFVNSMGDWKEESGSLGSIYTWGAKDVFVIDSLTFLGNAIQNHIMKLANRVGQKPQIQDFGAAIDGQESVIETLYNPAVNCNVIVTAHLNMTKDELQGGLQKAMPSALGQKLPAKIARYFNNVVLIEKTGTGAKVERKLVTTATHTTNLKVSKPSTVPPIMEPDLARLFDLLLAQ